MTIYRINAITQEDLDILQHRLSSETKRADAHRASSEYWKKEARREEEHSARIKAVMVAAGFVLFSVAFGFRIFRMDADIEVRAEAAERVEDAEGRAEAAEKRELESFRRRIDGACQEVPLP
jgi:type VI protein secretion system component VasF